MDALSRAEEDVSPIQRRRVGLSGDHQLQHHSFIHLAPLYGRTWTSLNRPIEQDERLMMERSSDGMLK